jgi:hypothetical protein
MGIWPRSSDQNLMIIGEVTRALLSLGEQRSDILLP